MVCQETCCTHCIHREVCSLKEEFLKAQTAANGISVNIGVDGGKYVYRELRQMTYIRPVQLECVHYIRLTNTRGV